VSWDDLPADHSHEQIDSRWAALSKLDRPAGQTETKE
jgi:uncharacterized protein